MKKCLSVFLVCLFTFSCIGNTLLSEENLVKTEFPEFGFYIEAECEISNTYRKDSTLIEFKGVVNSEDKSNIVTYTISVAPAPKIEEEDPEGVLELNLCVLIAETFDRIKLISFGKDEQIGYNYSGVSDDGEYMSCVLFTYKYAIIVIVVTSYDEIDERFNSFINSFTILN